MNITPIIEKFELLASQILELLQEERKSLKDGQPSDELCERKRGLIDQLSDSVVQIRAYRESSSENISGVKDRLAYVQQRLMKILQMDRELEKLYLGASNRPKIPHLVPAASRVGKAYAAAANI